MQMVHAGGQCKVSMQGKLAHLKVDSCISEQREPPEVTEHLRGPEKEALNPQGNFSSLGTPVPQFLQSCHRRGEAAVWGAWAMSSGELEGCAVSGWAGFMTGRSVPLLHGLSYRIECRAVGGVSVLAMSFSDLSVLGDTGMSFNGPHKIQLQRGAEMRLV